MSNNQNQAAQAATQGASIEAEILQALRWALEWIDAVPSDTLLPTMPGFDRDYVNGLIDRALRTQAAQADCTPAAAVSAGELPPLPPSRNKARDFEGWAEVYTSHEVESIRRAAIEADRAQRQAPVVREVPPKRDVPEAEYSGPVLENAMEIGEATGWNACIDATLAASPATVTAPAQPNKLASYPLEEMGVESAPDATRLFRASDWQLTVGDVRVARALAAPAAQQASPVFVNVLDFIPEPMRSEVVSGTNTRDLAPYFQAAANAAAAQQAAPTGTLGYALFRNGKQEGVERTRQQAESWVKAEIVPLVAAPATAGMVLGEPILWAALDTQGKIAFQPSSSRETVEEEAKNGRTPTKIVGLGIIGAGMVEDAKDAVRNILEELAEKFEAQHTWITNVAAANIVRTTLAARQAQASAKDEGGAA